MFHFYFQCFIFAFNVSFLGYNAERKKHHARKSKPQCKKIKNTVQEISEHNARDAECKRIRDAALSTFIHHYTFAAKSKSIKYDSRRTIRVGMETIPCTTQ